MLPFTRSAEQAAADAVWENPEPVDLADAVTRLTEPDADPATETPAFSEGASFTFKLPELSEQDAPAELPELSEQDAADLAKLDADTVQAVAPEGDL